MDNHLIKEVLKEITGSPLFNAYQYLSHIIGHDLGDSIAIKVENKQGDILYEEDCLEQVDGTLDTLDDNNLNQIIISTEYIEDYYDIYDHGDYVPKKYRTIKPAIFITVE